MDFESLQREKERIIEYVNECRNIYIYGAGYLAKQIIKLLNSMEISPVGCITSYKDQSTCLDFPVYTADEIKKHFQPGDGVILGFVGADASDIKARLSPAEPRLFSIDFSALTYYWSNFVVEKIEHEFGRREKTDTIGNVQNILVVRLDMVGDFVFITPFLRELRRNFPDSRITLVVRKELYGLAKNCPYISELLLYECPFYEVGLFDLYDLQEKYSGAHERSKAFAEKFFTGRKFDVVFFTRGAIGRNALDEKLLGLYSRAGYIVSRRLGTDDPNLRFAAELWDRFYSFVSEHSEPMHEADFTLQILRDLGLKAEDDRMELWLDHTSEEYAENVVIRRDNTTVAALGIVSTEIRRDWLPENYIDLIHLMSAKEDSDYLFVILGGNDAVIPAETILKGLSPDERAKVIDLSGKTDLAQLQAVMSKCDLYIGSNTGLLHIASAFGKPSVTVYSHLDDGLPTDGDSPVRMGAWRVPHIDLVPHAGLDGCHGFCRRSYSHCINLIRPENVLDAVYELRGQIRVQ